MLFPGGDDRYYNNLFIRPENDDTPDEPVIRSFFGNKPLADTEGFSGAQQYTAYPVGTAVYTGYPCPDDEKPWDIKPLPKDLDKEKLAVYVENNLYFNKALPYPAEKSPKVESGSGITFTIDWDDKTVTLCVTNPELFIQNAGYVIGTETLGFGFQAEMPFEKPDGTPHVFDLDFFGRHRGNKPTPGPFQVTMVETFKISFF